MGNETSSHNHKRGSGETKMQSPPPTLALVFGSRGVGKRSVWTQALASSPGPRSSSSAGGGGGGGFRFSVAYDDAAAGRQSMRVQTAEVEGVPVESVFAACDDATSTILTARFKQARVFVLVYDVCDRDSFLDVTARGTSMDLLALVQATRRACPSRDQRVFLVGNKIDEYADRTVWSPSSSSARSSANTDATAERVESKHGNAPEEREEDGGARAAALKALNHWRPGPACAGTLGKQARAALRARLRTKGRRREVSREEGRAVALQNDLLFFETSACSGDGVSVIRRALEVMHSEGRR